MSKPSFHLKNTLKSYPNLKPSKQVGSKLNGNSSPANNQAVQPQPSMGTKSVSTTALPAADNSVVQYHSSPDFLPSSASSTSAMAQDAGGVISPDTTLPARAIEEVNEVIGQIDGFLTMPDAPLDNFSNICQALKDLGENVDFIALQKHSQYPDVVNQLAPKIVAFWVHAQNQSKQLVAGASFNLFQVGRISYGLKACIELDRSHDFFPEQTWATLRPTICKLMRAVFDHIHQRKLLEAATAKDIGSILSLIEWLCRGVNHWVPNTSGPSAPTSTSASPAVVGLLAGFSKRENSPSLRGIANSAIDTLLKIEPNTFDTRQLGKLLMRLGRMIKDQSLVFQANETRPHADMEKLRKLVVGALGPHASKEYREKQHALAKGVVNPVTVGNLSEGLFALFDNQVLIWEEKLHVSVAVKVANFIKIAAESADEHNLKHYRKFLMQASENVTDNQSGVFAEGLSVLPTNS